MIGSLSDNFCSVITASVLSLTPPYIITLGSTEYQSVRPSQSHYRVTLAALTNPFTATKLAQVQLEVSHWYFSKLSSVCLC